MAVAPDAEGRLRLDAVQKGLRDLGWKDGENIQQEIRWASGKSDLIKTYAAELVAMEPEVILANATPVVAALRRVTQSIPIVFVNVADPLGSGFVETTARPGANITGFSNFEYS